MKKENVKELKIEFVENDELPNRVEIVSKDGESIYGAGETLSQALLAAFSVSGLFTQRNPSELANFIFWNFNGGENWSRAINTLTNKM